MTRCRVVIQVVAPAAATLMLVSAGCSGIPGEEMEAAPVPGGWEEEIRATRAERDLSFATSEDTPIHPDDRGTFQGLDYFAPDPAYRLVGPLYLHAEPEQFTILSTTGKERPAERYGELRFTLGGEHLTLQVYRLLDGPVTTAAEALFLPFTDRTSGIESYPAGRYVNLQEDGDGRYILDFNQAYNPLCAYGMPEKYACPVTPSENRLPVRIEAGEKGYRGSRTGAGTGG